MKTSVIDLRTCSKGDLLISTHGVALIYHEQRDSNMFSPFNHQIIYLEDGAGGSRTDSGLVFGKVGQPEDENVAFIIRDGEHFSAVDVLGVTHQFTLRNSDPVETWIEYLGTTEGEPIGNIADHTDFKPLNL